MKAPSLLVLLLLTVAGYSQTNLNGFKYVLVPERFDFSREDNQYGLNTTTKFLLEQKGFAAFVANEPLPPALAANKCNALKVEVSQRKAFLSTNLTLTLKDCQGNVIFKSKEGKSREKEFQVAYNEALREAFASLDAVPYKYDSTLTTQAQPVQQPTAMPAAPVAAPVASSSTPAAPPATPASTLPAAADITGTLYAQPTATGFQLVDMTPKKVLTLLKTSVADYFIAEAGGANGIVFKKEGTWYFEYYKDGKLVSQKLEIKF